MTLRPDDYDKNGDIIPDSVREEKKVRLIDAEALKKELTDAYFYNETLEMGEIKQIIDNAPTINAYSKDECEGEYLRGFTDCAKLNSVSYLHQDSITKSDTKTNSV